MADIASIVELRMLRRVSATAETRQSLQCSYTQSMHVKKKKTDLHLAFKRGICALAIKTKIEYAGPNRDRRMAENGFATPPPLGNFADISYLVEN